jgi:hypothetical protein
MVVLLWVPERMRHSNKKLPLRRNGDIGAPNEIVMVVADAVCGVTAGDAPIARIAQSR